MRTAIGLLAVVGLPLYYGGSVPLAAVLFGLLAGMSIEDVVARRSRERGE
jgi:hypothetical protein